MPLLTQAEVERQIAELCDRLEDQTREYAKLCDEAAQSEADWKRAYWRATMTVAAQSSEGRTNATYRDAKISQVADGMAGENRFLRYRLAAERQKAMQAAMATTRAVLDGRRSLGANLRPQVGR